MKKTKSLSLLLVLISVFALLTTVRLTFKGAALAQEPEPEAITALTITPSSLVAGNSTTVNINFDVPNVNLPNSICFYYLNSQIPFGGSSVFPSGPVISALGDSYTVAFGGSVGAGIGLCPGVSGRWAVEFSVSDPDDFADGGDSFTFNITIPLGTPPGSKTLTSRQYNTGFINTLNTPFTVLAPPSTIYVSNTAGCGSNTPCYTGPSALQQAMIDVAHSGNIIIYSIFSQGGGLTAQLTGSKSVIISGINNPLIQNGGGTCSGAMIENSGSGTLEFIGVSLNGSCASGARTEGILQSGSSGKTVVRDSFTTISNFSGASAAALRVTNGTLVAHGNTFQSNQQAFAQTGGTLHAFANNINTNLSANAATRSAGTANVGCNYWGSSTISGFSSVDFEQRLGAPVVNYAEGTGLQTLGAASLASITGTHVLVNMGRSNPPFNNGTVSGLGALASDFFAVCGTRSTPITSAGTITITADNVTPGTIGFHLHIIEDALECSPSTNTACWDDLAGIGTSCNSAGCSVFNTNATNILKTTGHFVIGNTVDPTAVTLQTIGLRSSSTAVWSASLLMASLLGVTLIVLRRRRA